jgi:hypothetical protein
LLLLRPAVASICVPVRLYSLGQIVPLTGAPAKAGTKAICPRSLRLHKKPRFAGPPLPGEASSEAEALQLRGVADYKSSAQRVGALCLAGLTLRMASRVLPCSRELMRSATDLSEDSKGTRTFLWPWVQHLGIAGGFWPFLTAKRAIPVRGYQAESCGIYGATIAQHHLKSPAGDGLLMVPLRLG